MDTHIVSSFDSSEFTHLTRTLSKSTVIGLDAEWKPVRSQRSTFPTVTLLQLACQIGDDSAGWDESVVFLLDLSSLPLPSIWGLIKDVLVSPDILKLGFKFKQDLIYLSSTFRAQGGNPGFDQVEPYMDITNIYKFLQHKQGKKISKDTKSLSAICEEILGLHLSKELQCSDWSHRPLTEEQIRYAAKDAHCLLGIFKIFQAKVIKEGPLCNHVNEQHQSNVSLGLKGILEMPKKPLTVEEAIEAAKGFQKIPNCLFDKNLEFWQCMDCNQLYWEWVAFVMIPNNRCPEHHDHPNEMSQKQKRDLWRQTKTAFKGDKKMDIHMKLMKYKFVPTWWFVFILVSNIGLVLFTCQYYNESLQLPWWGVLVACAIAFFFILLIGTRLQDRSLHEDSTSINVHGTGDGNTCGSFGVHHNCMVAHGKIPHLCDTSLLPPDSLWTCPMDRVFFDVSVIWGFVGPRRIFGTKGEYSNVNWFFLSGAVAPLLVWLAHNAYPNKQWIHLIHMPVLLGSTAMMPPATTVNFRSRRDHIYDCVAIPYTASEEHWPSMVGIPTANGV
ncbi:hypothetical protein GOBAR_DD17068 [Gossypium barbadense]|nr:hypothetical protein GOBAR_DD17068 [Gossypium barbadense]